MSGALLRRGEDTATVAGSEVAAHVGALGTAGDPTSPAVEHRPDAVQDDATGRQDEDGEHRGQGPYGSRPPHEPPSPGDREQATSSSRSWAMTLPGRAINRIAGVFSAAPVA